MPSPASAVAASAAALVLAVAAAAWHADAAGWELWSAQEAASAIAEEKAVFDRQVAAGNRVAGELAAGRVGAWEAGDLLAEVNRGRPGYLVGLRLRFPDAGTDRERYARQSAARAAELTDDPSARAELVARLDAELDAPPP